MNHNSVSRLFENLGLATQGRGQDFAEQLGLQRKGTSFFCPTPERHAHGGKRPCVYVNPDTGFFQCMSTNCGIKGSLVMLAQVLGHPDPWGEVVRLSGITLTPEEQNHLDNLRKKGVR